MHALAEALLGDPKHFASISFHSVCDLAAADCPAGEVAAGAWPRGAPLARVAVPAKSRVSPMHLFSGNPLDRAQHQRLDDAWLAESLADSASRFLPMHRLDVLVK
jgi:hypothetical protein